MSVTDWIKRLGRRLRPERRRAGPLLSVIVPVYNAAPYLGESIGSLLTQTLTDLEIICVDDGSTDGSQDILRDFAARDPRVRFIQAEHGGPGAARNVGLRQARGEYIGFADSDDHVPPSAYRTLVDQLQQSGSDLVSGVVRRGHGTHTSTPVWIRRTHGVRQSGITLDEHPEMLLDITSANKVIRRAFADRIDFGYPEGVHYEDQEPWTQAYLLASSFDVVPKTVYIWMVRSDGTSITQQKASIGDLRDRLRALRACRDLVERHGSDVVRRAWYTKVAGWDLPAYYRLVPGADDAYWQQLVDGVGALGAGFTDEALLGSSGPHRFLTWLVLHRDRDALLTLLTHLEASAGGLEVRWDGTVGKFRLPEPLRDRIPARLNQVASPDLWPRARLAGATVTPDALVLTGYAFLNGADTAAVDVGLEVALVCERNGERVVLRTERQHDPDAQRAGRSPWENHLGAGFSATVTADRLVDPDRAVRRWRLELRQWVGELQYTHGVDSVDRTGSAALGVPHVIGDAVVQVVRAATGAVVRARRSWVIIDEATVHGPDLHLTLRQGTIAAVVLRVHDADTADAGHEFAVTDGRVVLPVAALRRGDLRARFATGPEFPVNLPADVDVRGIAGTGWRLRRTRDNGAGTRLTDAPVIVIDGVDEEGGAIAVTGSLHGANEVRLRWEDPSGGARSTSIGAGPFRARFAITADHVGFDQDLSPAGVYRLGGVDGDDVEFVVAGRLWGAPERTFSTAHHRWRATWNDGGITLTAEPLSVNHAPLAPRRQVEEDRPG